MHKCPVLDLTDELDVVLGHEWCKAHQVVISYKDENVTFVHKGQSHLFHFDDSDAQTRTSSSTLCSSWQAKRFVQKQNAHSWSWFGGSLTSWGGREPFGCDQRNWQCSNTRLSSKGATTEG